MDVRRSIQDILTDAGVNKSLALECAAKIVELVLPSQTEAAKTAIASLSFSELTLILAIFSELKIGEGIVVAAGNAGRSLLRCCWQAGYHPVNMGAAGRARSTVQRRSGTIRKERDLRKPGRKELYIMVNL